jgi:hypothetical protein
MTQNHTVPIEKSSTAEQPSNEVLEMIKNKIVEIEESIQEKIETLSI